MTESGEGVAYRFWLRIQQELARQRMDQTTLVKRSGISANTMNNFKTSTRPPATRIIDAISGVLGINYEEALWLAGHPGALPPATMTQLDVREAIRNSSVFTEAQKRTLLEMTDVYEEANRLRITAAEKASRGEDPSLTA